MRAFPIEPVIDDSLRERHKSLLDEYREHIFKGNSEDPEAVYAKLEKAILSHQSVVEQATRPFPLSKRDTLKALLAPISNSVLHPLTRVAHLLLNHYKIVDEPHMLSGVDRAFGYPMGVLCQCFYATVRFKDDQILVYSTWDEGGMCPEKDANLAAIVPIPEYMQKLMPRLSEIADEMAQLGDRDFNPPRKVLIRAPAHQEPSL